MSECPMFVALDPRLLLLVSTSYTILSCHNHFFTYDFEKLITMMQKVEARIAGLKVHENWTSGQGKYELRKVVTA